MIFTIRFITAACLFILLGKANIWLSPISNVILAIGYRFFLVLSPLFSRITGKYAVCTSLITAVLGVFLFCFDLNIFLILGSIFVGVGLSTSGFLIKAKAAETPQGAAHNKIALNLGSLLSGLILLVSFNSKQLFFAGCALVLLFTAIGAFIKSKNEVASNNNPALTTSIPSNKQQFFAWLFVGIAVGIKLFGVFSVLPQYLIAQNGSLPNWYGLMILLNSTIVILFQLPIIHWIDKYSENNTAFKIVIFVMILGMLIISCPSVFFAEHFWGAISWIVLLSLIECFASYLDLLGSRAKFLLVKETAVGLGAGITVLLSRTLPSPISSITIGLIGIGTILTASFLLKKERQVSKTYDKISHNNWIEEPA